MQSLYSNAKEKQNGHFNRLAIINSNNPRNDFSSVIKWIDMIRNREDNAVVDNTIQNFKKPLVYKDMLLSGVFKDGLLSEKGKSRVFQ